jgi:hypothetical protein
VDDAQSAPIKTSLNTDVGFHHCAHFPFLAPFYDGETYLPHTEVDIIWDMERI